MSGVWDAGEVGVCLYSFTHTTGDYCAPAVSQSLGVSSELDQLPDLGKVPSSGETTNN